jgi:ABC-type tungstate transport system permease subunit
MAELKSRAYLENAQGIHIVNPLPISNCDVCEARRMCETIMQEEAEVVVPQSQLCLQITVAGTH